ncbi:MAG: hypothetical protein ACREBE_08810 [bacterium]
MSKKKTASKKSSTKKTKRATSNNPTAAARETSAAAATDEASETAEDSVSRLPPEGTVIKKVDRHDTVRCQCTVVEGGIRYKGRVFRSLSGAAMAAATDLGLKNKTQNGYTFWGLTKPARKLTDPVGALKKSSKRFHVVATVVTGTATDQNRAKIRAGLEDHKASLENLLAQVAA